MATAIQAGLAGLIGVLVWPLATDLLESVRTIPLPALNLQSFEALVGQAETLRRSFAAMLEPLSGWTGAWLRLAPQWVALWPTVIAAAVLLAVLGNSVLLVGHGAGRRRILPRRS